MDFSAIFDVSFDWADLPGVPARLDEVTPALAAIWSESRSGQPPWSLHLREWSYYVAGPYVEEDEQDELSCRLCPGLDGPMHFHVVPHRGFATTHNPARWKFFLQQVDDRRDQLRRSCRVIGAALGARRVMYVPDLALEDMAEHRLYDEPYETVVAHFRGAWGGPSDFGETYPIGERYWERYFVELIDGSSPAQ
ncbi:MAG TPA: hypothetical protein VEA69_19235 [Tepidisphaeraceae bacterium]|nr:hypothetical protein [Tepidisphaeraceae bacterium]